VQQEVNNESGARTWSYQHSSQACACGLSVIAPWVLKSFELDNLDCFSRFVITWSPVLFAINHIPFNSCKRPHSWLQFTKKITALW